MASTVRSRELAARQDEVWNVVADPHHLPRWWPGVTRVEDVTRERFTVVVPTKRGKPMRLDQQVTTSEAPSRRAWTQNVAGTPFERLLESWETVVTLESRPQGTLVTIAESQQLRGSFRLGVLLQRRPARRRLDQALSGLARLFD